MKTTEAIENIFTINLAVKKNERVLVFTDIGDDIEGIGGIRDVAIKVAEVGRSYSDIVYTEFPSTGSHGTEPPVELWRAAMGDGAVDELEEGGLLERILNKAATPEDVTKAEAIIKAHKTNCVSAVVALSRYSTSHTRFRGLLAKAAGTRYASMPNFEEVMLTGVMTANWREIEERTIRLAEALSGADMVSVKTPNGTSITFSIKGRTVEPDTGIITEPGTFGNLPAGEAFVAPVEGTAEGVLVLEWGPNSKLSSPVKVTVTEGRAVKVEGTDPYASELRKIITDNPLFGNIAELGIGTNDKAERAHNILESEKILGTIHIALGDNAGFGGTVRVPFHQDFVFFNPTLEVEKDGKRLTILKDGKLFCAS